MHRRRLPELHQAPADSSCGTQIGGGGASVSVLVCRRELFELRKPVVDNLELGCRTILDDQEPIASRRNIVVRMSPVVPNNGTIEDLTADGLAIVETPNPTAFVLGAASIPPDPSDRGISMSWVGCQTGDGTKVLLSTLEITNTDCVAGEAPMEVPIHVIRHDSPSNVFFQCPLFTQCDGSIPAA